MSPEQRDRFLHALDETAKSLGDVTLDQGLEIANLFISTLHELFEKVKTRELFAYELEHNDLSPEMGELLISFAEQLPRFARFAVDKASNAVIRDLPSPVEGRPTLPAVAQLEIVKYVQHLYVEKKVPVRVAMQRAADKFNCGLRSVQRCWKKRDQILEQGPEMRFPDVLSAIQERWKRDSASGKTGLELLFGIDTHGRAPGPWEN